MIRILTAYHFQPTPDQMVENLVYRSLVLPVRGPPGTRDAVMEDNSFAEMRAHHWAQQNWESGITHYGIQHYRRWFFFPKLYGPASPGFNPVPWTVLASMLEKLRAMTTAQQEALSALVGRFDIVTVNPIVLDIRENFVGLHGEGPWRQLMDVLDALKWEGPRNAEVFFPANMFIAAFEPFSRYMTLWREVMDMLLPRIKPERGTVQERIFGFLSERLWTLWLVHERRRGKLALGAVPVITCPEWKA
jgi:hypothetical protein